MEAAHAAEAADAADATDGPMSSEVVVAHTIAADRAEIALAAAVAAIPSALTHDDSDALDMIQSAMYLACRIGISWVFVETGDIALARQVYRTYSYHFPQDFERIQSLQSLFLSGGVGLYSDDDSYGDERDAWLGDFVDDDEFGDGSP